jgi:hypothetical protein
MKRPEPQKKKPQVEKKKENNMTLNPADEKKRVNQAKDKKKGCC